MNEIEIIKVTCEEVETLQKISIQTFSDTFAPMNSEENMRIYLEKSFTIKKLKDELNNPDSTFYFAKIDHQVVGYLKLNFGSSQTELKDQSAIEIERIYVSKDYHGKNVGQLLFQKAIGIGKENHYNYIWLGVWEKNYRALKFYRKNGFREFDTHIFMMGNEEQTDLLMKLDL